MYFIIIRKYTNFDGIILDRLHVSPNWNKNIIYVTNLPFVLSRQADGVGTEKFEARIGRKFEEVATSSSRLIIFIS